MFCSLRKVSAIYCTTAYGSASYRLSQSLFSFFKSLMDFFVAGKCGREDQLRNEKRGHWKPELLIMCP